MKTAQIVEIIAACLMVVVVLSLVIHRLIRRMGIGARVIQFLTVGLLIPAILILALEGVLSAETTGTLYGTLMGYLLSGIGEFKPGGKKEDKKTNPAIKSGQDEESI